MVNETSVPEGEAAGFKEVESLMVPSRNLALEVGDARPANVVILGAAVEKAGVVRPSTLKKALEPALDPRYHHMIDKNSEALDRRAHFARIGQ